MGPDVVGGFLERLRGRGPAGPPARPQPAADTRRRSKWISVAPVDGQAADLPVPVMMGDTAVEEGRAAAAAAEATGPGYMRLVERADERRRAEGAEGKAPGISEPNDGKRSLATWHAPDSYAFGVVLWEVCTLRRPWAGVLAAHQIWLRVEKGAAAAPAAASGRWPRGTRPTATRSAWCSGSCSRWSSPGRAWAQTKCGCACSEGSAPR